MRTYGRIGTTWYVIQTAANGNNDNIWITTLCQCLKLNLGESPFWANYGLPSQPSVQTQIAPDYYVNQTQKQFSQYFASIVIVRNPPTPNGAPSYKINILTNVGTPVSLTLAT